MTGHRRGGKLLLGHALPGGPRLGLGSGSYRDFWFRGRPHSCQANIIEASEAADSDPLLSLAGF